MLDVPASGRSAVRLARHVWDVEVLGSNPSAPTNPRSGVASREEIDLILNSLEQIERCSLCATRLRYGDFECPHCGADLESTLSGWAERLADRLRRS